MSDVNLNIPLELLADAVIHKLDKNSRVRKLVAEAVVHRLAREDVAETAAGMWLRELQAEWSQAKLTSAFNAAVAAWLDGVTVKYGLDGYLKKATDKAVESSVNSYVHAAVFKLTKEIRADVLTVLRSRLVTLNNEQLVELLKATETKDS